MQNPFPPFVKLALHKGANQDLQLVAIGSDGQLYVPAWQRFGSGQWIDPGVNLLSSQDGMFQDVVLGSGYQNMLQVLGLGMDQRIYLGAYQDGAGQWHVPASSNAGPLGNASRTYTALTTCRGNSNLLQVLGIGTDGQIYLVAYQDQYGTWRPPHPVNSGPFGTPGKSYTALAAANGNSRYLQVLAIGTDGQIYHPAWQDGNGVWHQKGERVGNPTHKYLALAAANGNSGYLQVLALGTDKKLYLAAWQDGDGSWHLSERYSGPLGNESHPYSAVMPCMGADNHLQVVCLGELDGKAYLPAYQKQSGSWYATGAQFYGPLGDPSTSYRQLVLANGNNAAQHHPGNLQVVGLGASDANSGLPCLVSWQGADGAWHPGFPLDKTLSPLVNWQAPTGQVVDAACVGFGRLWVAQGSSVISFDTISGMPGPKLFPFTNNSNPRAIQPWNGKLAVICDDGNIHLADPDTGAISRLATVGLPNWASVAGERLIVASDSGVYSVAADGSVVGPYGGGSIAAAPVVASGILYVPIHSSSAGISEVVALDPATLAREWSIPADGTPGPVFCNGSLLCFATSNKSLYVYSVGGRFPLTPNKIPIGLTMESDILPIVNGEACFVVLGDIVQKIDWSTGEQATPIGPIPQPVGTPVMSDTGVLYYASDGPIAVIDTTAKVSGFSTWDTGGGPVLAAHQDGALYYAAQDLAASVRLEELTHRFYVETCLINDFDFSSGTENPHQTPNFQVEVALFNEDGSGRPMQAVRITGSAAGRLTWQRQPSPVSPTDAVDVVTDGTGRLRLAVAAGSQDSKGTFRPGLAAPELVLEAPFIDPRVRFVIRPHSQMQEQLATITPDQLGGAKGLDGQSILTDDYQHGDDLENATRAINQTASMVRTSMEGPRTRDAGNAYCDPACDMAVACCMPANNLSTPVVCRQSFSFDLTPRASHFRFLGTDDAGEAARVLEARGVPGSWDDFWDDVKSGAAKVTAATFEVLDDGVQATIRAGEKVVKGIIRTVEQAVLVVQGIFNQIATAIERVIEALSFLFDWGKIIDLHNQIRTEVTAAWSSLATGSNGVSYDTIKASFDQELGTLKTRADAALQKARTAVGRQSVLGAQKTYSGQPNVASGSSQNNWLLAKTQDSILPALPGRAAAAAAIPMPSEVDWPQFNLSQELVDLLDQFLDKISATVSDDVKATIDRIREQVFASSRVSLLDRGFSVIIDIVQGLLDIAIDLGKAVVDLMMDLLKAVMAEVVSVLSQEIRIPWLSDLYEWATGSKLTLLDLFSLIIAVPAAFALKLISRQPAYASGVSPLPPAELVRRGIRRKITGPLPVSEWTIIAGAGQVAWGLLSGIVSTIHLAMIQGRVALPTKKLNGLRFISGLLGIYVRGAFALANRTSSDPLVWLLWSIPTTILALDTLTSAIGAETSGLINDFIVNLSAVVVGTLGCGFMLIFGSVQFFVGCRSPSDVLELLFCGCVGIGILGRLYILVGQSPGMYGVLAGMTIISVAGLALSVSGILEIARGVLGITEQHEPRYPPASGVPAD